MPYPSFASSPLCSAPHQQGEGACGYCPDKQHTQVLNLGPAAGSAPGSLLLCSSTGPSCQRLAPRSGIPACHAAPGLIARCQPDTLSHSSRRYATSITGIHMISQAPPAAFTRIRTALPLPLLLTPGAVRVHSPTKQTGGSEPTVNCVPSNASPHNTKLPPSCRGIWLCLCTPPPQRRPYEDDDPFSLQTQSCAFLSKSVQIVLTSS